MSKPRLALVYDRVNTPFGGAEKLLLTLHELYPDAPLYTSVYDVKKAPWAKVFTVRSSFLNKFSWLKDKHQLVAFLMPLAFESFDFSAFDLVISISSAESKGVITKPQTKHLCYLLTPPRYLYSHREFFLRTSLVFNFPIIGWLAKKLLDYLTIWDQIAIHRPDLIVPISQLVKRRVQEFYDLKVAEPIFPSLVPAPPANFKDSPTSVTVANHPTRPNESVTVANHPTRPLLIVSRLVPYKQIDLAIRVCEELEQPLTIVGQGEKEEYLHELVTKPKLIKFYKNLSASKLAKMYETCQAVLMPGEEDFGIVALEALAHHKPVLINANSGASELIEDGKTGLHLKRLDLEGLKTDILEARKYDFDPAIMSRCLRQHNQESFKKQFNQAVQTVLRES